MLVSLSGLVRLKDRALVKESLCLDKVGWLGNPNQSFNLFMASLMGTLLKHVIMGKRY